MNKQGPPLTGEHKLNRAQSLDSVLCGGSKLGLVGFCVQEPQGLVGFQFLFSSQGQGVFSCPFSLYRGLTFVNFFLINEKSKKKVNSVTLEVRTDFFLKNYVSFKDAH